MPDSNRMKIVLEINPEATRRWHGWILQELLQYLPEEQISVLPGISFRPPRTVETYLTLERILFGRKSALDRMDFHDLPRVNAFPAEEADVILDLAGADVSTAASTATDARRLQLLFDNMPGEPGALVAILRGTCPRVTLAGPRAHLFLGRPALQGGQVVRRAANALLARTAQLVARQLAKNKSVLQLAAVSPSPVLPATTRMLHALTGELVRRARKKMRRLLGLNPPRWRTGWRHCPHAYPLWRTGHFDPAEWTFLPDDHRRFYADPFPFVHEGALWVFVEEYPFSTGMGIISAYRIDEHGQMVEGPVPVLETDVHVSYPLVFAHDGRIWMLPETSDAGELRLYFCETFPHRWRLHSVLLDRPVSDATLFHDGTRFWIMATDTTPPASSWDALLLFHAERLEGPWTPHPDNPVLVDCASARPGGRVWQENGRWLRPAQVCEHGYGTAVVVCEMEQFHPDRPFSQHEVCRIRNIRGGNSVHTYNSAAGFEFMDTFHGFGTH